MPTRGQRSVLAVDVQDRDHPVVEAVEWAGQDTWPVLGVQWHPELPVDATGERVFRWLVAAGR